MAYNTVRTLEENAMNWGQYWDWGVWSGIIAILLGANALGVLLTALQLPGTWLMLLATSLFVWLRDDALITWWTPVVLLGLCIVGEVIETVASAWGSGKEGGSKRGMLLSIVGGIAGAIVATFAIPVPIVGTIIGAAAGAGVGAALGDRWAGREWEPAWRAGRGAAIGRFWGAVGKLGVAGVMFLVVVAALLWE